MPKNERKQFLNKLQSNQNQNYPYNMPPPMPGYPPYMYPPMFPRPVQNRGHKNNYKKPTQPNPQPVPQQIMNQVPPVQNQNINNNREDEPNLEYLMSLNDTDAQKDYLGEYLFKKIEQHPIAQSKNLTVETISRITGMILGIGDIKEIYDITINNESITARINEALTLLEIQ